MHRPPNQGRIPHPPAARTRKRPFQAILDMDPETGNPSTLIPKSSYVQQLEDRSALLTTRHSLVRHSHHRHQPPPTAPELAPFYPRLGDLEGPLEAAVCRAFGDGAARWSRVGPAVVPRVGRKRERDGGGYVQAIRTEEEPVKVPIGGLEGSVFGE